MGDLANILSEWTKDLQLSDVPSFLMEFGKTFVLPISVVLIGTAVALTILNKLVKIFLPQSNEQRHLEILKLYQKDKDRGTYREHAMYEWRRDLPTYGPSLLSRACHEIYVAHQPQRGLQLLEILLTESKEVVTTSTKKNKNKNNKHKKKTDKDVSYYLKEAQNMKADALAIHHGNARMVDMNARIAKQEHLGIYTTM